ncbi:MAG: hypothetical protein IJY14_02500 [Acholeplasmatales bacterium]|nr:hypothetical protein [Acholeplasmatales bacterium]
MKKKENRITKMVMLVAALISLVVGGYYAYETFITQNGINNYFYNHFATAVCLACVGVIALCLPTVLTKTIAGDNKGDNIVIVAGFIMFIIAIFNIIISYIG